MALVGLGLVGLGLVGPGLVGLAPRWSGWARGSAWRSPAWPSPGWSAWPGVGAALDELAAMVGVALTGHRPPPR